MGSPLQEKSKAFALQIIKVCNEVKREKRESVLTNQLVHSGTSVGANIREAFYTHGRADFIAKLQIALKECSESEYWRMKKQTLRSTKKTSFRMSFLLNVVSQQANDSAG